MVIGTGLIVALGAAGVIALVLTKRAGAGTADSIVPTAPVPDTSLPIGPIFGPGVPVVAEPPVPDPNTDAPIDIPLDDVAPVLDPPQNVYQPPGDVAPIVSDRPDPLFVVGQTVLTRRFNERVLILRVFQSKSRWSYRVELPSGGITSITETDLVAA